MIGSHSKLVDRLGLMGLWAVMALGLWFFHSRGWVVHDEGWFLQAGLRMLQGDVVYRDFQFIYQPGGVYLNSLAFLIFGPSILASRIIIALNSLVALIALFGLARQLKLSLITTSGLLLLYLTWGPGHINFLWPVMLALSSAVVASWALVKAEATPKNYRYLFLIGLMAGLTCLWKQNFGVAFLLSSLLFIALVPAYRKLKMLIPYSAGLLLVAGIQGLYMLATGSLAAYIQDMRYLLIERVIGQGVLNSPYPWEYPASWPYQVAKIGLYTSPLTIALIAGGVAWIKRQRFLAWLPLLVASYYLLSIRPTTDYVHLAPLLALTVLPLAVLLHLLNRWWAQAVVLASLWTMVAIGTYTAVFGQFYRWDTPLIKLSHLPRHASVGIAVDQKAAQEIADITSFFAANATEDPLLFVYSFSPTWYLVLNKYNPTPYDYLHIGVLSPEVETAVTQALEAEQLRYVLTDVPLENDRTAIGQYLNTHYFPIKKVNTYTIWQRSN